MFTVNFAHMAHPEKKEAVPFEDLWTCAMKTSTQKWSSGRGGWASFASSYSLNKWWFTSPISNSGSISNLQQNNLSAWPSRHFLARFISQKFKKTAAEMACEETIGRIDVMPSTHTHTNKEGLGVWLMIQPIEKEQTGRDEEFYFVFRCFRWRHLIE